MSTRKEHMQWCKQRALEYAEAGDLTNAIGSMLSDLGKNEETARLQEGIGGLLAMDGMMKAQSNDTQGVIQWIHGFTE